MVATSPPNVGSRISVRLVVVLFVGGILAVAAFFTWRSIGVDAGPTSLRIATGPAGGVYRAIGSRFATLLVDKGVIADAEALPTAGSRANADLLGTGEVDFAIVQSDTPLPDDARLVAELYDETLHTLVAPALADSVTHFDDLRKLRVSLGPLGSGTRQVVDRLLTHFDVRVGEIVDVPHDELGAAFATGRLDVAFVLTAMPSTVVAATVRDGGARLMSLETPQEGVGLADGLGICFPAYREIVIPRGTYGLESSRSAVTIGVGAWLVCRAALPAETVRATVATIFEHRLEATGGGARMPRIVERYAPQAVDLAYHAGATAYYVRDEPPFLVEYAEAISLGLTLLVGVFSAMMALREWLRRTRKNRIDAYYNLVREHSGEIDDASRADLRALRRELNAIRQRAFDDLVAERLDADSSFIIFQDYLRGELESIDQRLARIADAATVNASGAGSHPGGT